MPKIFLKPNSPEFAEPRETHDSRARHCEMMGCPAQGDHKAPKNRGLNEYHYFCIDHVREYNQAWNFFSGMSDNEVQDHMMKSMYGDRPTWRYDTDVRAAENLRRAAWSTYNYTEGDPADKQDKQDKNLQRPSSNSPEYQAMIVMGLEPPVVFEEIKTRYKELAKKHHPDLNRGCTESEERLKQINMAYTILKVAYEAFERLPER